MKIYRHRISCPLAWLLLETLAAGGGNEAVREKSRVPSAGSSLTRLVGEISSRARALEKAGDLEGALEAWREAGFLLPEDSAVSREVKRVSLGLAKEKLSRAKEELKPEARGRAAELLLESWDLSPTPDAASFLSKIGYRLHLGVWKKEEEVKAFDADEEEREVEARGRLGLSCKRFRKVRTDHFRLFTDMPGGREWDRWLEPVLKVLEGMLSRYREAFPGLVSRDAADGGFNVVFFRDRKAYEEHLKAQGIVFSFETAGVYFPQLRSSLFYREPNHAKVWPPLLHEITHQLNEELLHAARAPWLNEGLAVYFEAGLVESDFRVTAGRPHHRNLRYLRREHALDGGRYIPAAEILGTRSVAELVRAGHPVDQVYAQMWAWACFFLGDLGRRKVLLECLRKERVAFERGDGQDAQETYHEVFGAQGLEEKDLDQEYKRFVRSMEMRP